MLVIGNVCRFVDVAVLAVAKLRFEAETAISDSTAIIRYYTLAQLPVIHSSFVPHRCGCLSAMEDPRARARSPPPTVTQSISFGSQRQRIVSTAIPFSCASRANRYVEERQRLRHMKAGSLAVRFGYLHGPLIPIDSPPPTEQEPAAAAAEASEQTLPLSGTSSAK